MMRRRVSKQTLPGVVRSFSGTPVLFPPRPPPRLPTVKPASTTDWQAVSVRKQQDTGIEHAPSFGDGPKKRGPRNSKKRSHGPSSSAFPSKNGNGAEGREYTGGWAASEVQLGTPKSEGPNKGILGSMLSTMDQFRRVFLKESTVVEAVPLKRPIVGGWVSWVVNPQLEFIFESRMSTARTDDPLSSADANNLAVRRVMLDTLKMMANGGALSPVAGLAAFKTECAQNTVFLSAMDLLDSLDLTARFCFNLRKSNEEWVINCRVEIHDPYSTVGPVPAQSIGFPSAACVHRHLGSVSMGGSHGLYTLTCKAIDDLLAPQLQHEARLARTAEGEELRRMLTLTASAGTSLFSGASGVVPFDAIQRVKTVAVRGKGRDPVMALRVKVQDSRGNNTSYESRSHDGLMDGLPDDASGAGREADATPLGPDEMSIAGVAVRVGALRAHMAAVVRDRSVALALRDTLGYATTSAEWRRNLRMHGGPDSLLVFGADLIPQIGSLHVAALTCEQQHDEDSEALVAAAAAAPVLDESFVTPAPAGSLSDVVESQIRELIGEDDDDEPAIVRAADDAALGEDGPQAAAVAVLRVPSFLSAYPRLSVDELNATLAHAYGLRWTARSPSSSGTTLDLHHYAMFRFKGRFLNQHHFLPTPEVTDPAIAASELQIRKNDVSSTNTMESAATTSAPVLLQCGASGRVFCGSHTALEAQLPEIHENWAGLFSNVSRSEARDGKGASTKVSASSSFSSSAANPSDSASFTVVRLRACLDAMRCTLRAVSEPPATDDELPRITYFIVRTSDESVLWRGTNIKDALPAIAEELGLGVEQLPSSTITTFDRDDADAAAGRLSLTSVVHRAMDTVTEGASLRFPTLSLVRRDGRLPTQSGCAVVSFAQKLTRQQHSHDEKLTIAAADDAALLPTSAMSTDIVCGLSPHVAEVSRHLLLDCVARFIIPLCIGADGALQHYTNEDFFAEATSAGAAFGGVGTAGQDLTFLEHPTAALIPLLTVRNKEAVVASQMPCAAVVKQFIVRENTVPTSLDELHGLLKIPRTVHCNNVSTITFKSVARRLLGAFSSFAITPCVAHPPVALAYCTSDVHHRDASEGAAFVESFTAMQVSCRRSSTGHITIGTSFGFPFHDAGRSSGGGGDRIHTFSGAHNHAPSGSATPASQKWSELLSRSIPIARAEGIEDAARFVLLEYFPTAHEFCEATRLAESMVFRRSVAIAMGWRRSHFEFGRGPADRAPLCRFVAQCHAPEEKAGFKTRAELTAKDDGPKHAVFEASATGGNYFEAFVKCVDEVVNTLILHHPTALDAADTQASADGEGESTFDNAMTTTLRIRSLAQGSAADAPAAASSPSLRFDEEDTLPLIGGQAPAVPAEAFFESDEVPAGASGFVEDAEGEDSGELTFMGQRFEAGGADRRPGAGVASLSAEMAMRQSKFLAPLMDHVSIILTAVNKRCVSFHAEITPVATDSLFDLSLVGLTAVRSREIVARCTTTSENLLSAIFGLYRTAVGEDSWAAIVEKVNANILKHASLSGPLQKLTRHLSRDIVLVEDDNVTFSKDVIHWTCEAVIPLRCLTFDPDVVHDHVIRIRSSPQRTKKESLNDLIERFQTASGLHLLAQAAPAVPPPLPQFDSGAKVSYSSSGGGTGYRGDDLLNGGRRYASLLDAALGIATGRLARKFPQAAIHCSVSDEGLELHMLSGRESDVLWRCNTVSFLNLIRGYVAIAEAFAVSTDPSLIRLLEGQSRNWTPVVHPTAQMRNPLQQSREAPIPVQFIQSVVRRYLGWNMVAEGPHSRLSFGLMKRGGNINSRAEYDDEVRKGKAAMISSDLSSGAGLAGLWSVVYEEPMWSARIELGSAPIATGIHAKKKEAFFMALQQAVEHSFPSENTLRLPDTEWLLKKEFLMRSSELPLVLSSSADTTTFERTQRDWSGVEAPTPKGSRFQRRDTPKASLL